MKQVSNIEFIMVHGHNEGQILDETNNVLFN